MASIAATSPNEDQIAQWNGSSGATWVAMQENLDAQIEPLGLEATRRLAPAPGERIIDIGCGCGQTSLELARRVGPSGAVLGVDVSAPMLDLARRRASGARLTQVRFQQADAQTHPFDEGAADAVFSRFGVMFFADPVAAFANIRRGVKSGGRLAFVCWRTPGENPWMTLPMQAAMSVLPPGAVPAAPPPPTGSEPPPGPFAFADRLRVEQILTAAGFKDVAIEPYDARMGGNDLEASVRMAMQVGPLGGVLRTQPDLVPIVTQAVRDALAAHSTPSGILLASGSWMVTARA